MSVGTLLLVGHRPMVGDRKLLLVLHVHMLPLEQLNTRRLRVQTVRSNLIHQDQWLAQRRQRLGQLQLAQHQHRLPETLLVQLKLREQEDCEQ